MKLRYLPDFFWRYCGICSIFFGGNAVFSNLQLMSLSFLGHLGRENFFSSCSVGEQGYGAVVRALPSHQCGLGLITEPSLMSFSLGFPVFLPTQKLTLLHVNSNFRGPQANSFIYMYIINIYLLINLFANYYTI